ncbi:MAG: 5-oxoprolinase subunit PxpA [Actinomycetes bacterium]
MDINVDMGESFGRYTLGDDEGIMKAGATSANIATCFHAGDPNVLLRTVRWAKQYGVNIGVHTGLPDPQGFGRRRMDITGDELYADTLYQIGAIAAVCKVVDVPLRHVKAHGILYRMVGQDELYVDAFLKAVADYDPGLWIMCQRSDPIYERGLGMGLKMAAEALIDLGYDDEGHWVIERVKKARSVEEVGARAVQVATEGIIETTSGGTVPLEAVTVCCHGDAPNAVEEVTAVVKALKDSGIDVAPLSI